MSYNLRLWTRHPIEKYSMPVDKEHIVNIENSVAVEPEDMPAEVFLSVSDIKFLTDINIEPYPENNTFIEKVIQYVKKLANENIGVLENPQTGLLYTPSGIKKASLPPITKDGSTVSLSWYMDSKYPLKYKLPVFVDLLKENMPKALPRRYGSFEPPQYKLEETGIEHLKEFLLKEDQPVWYATKPVTYLFISDAYGNAGPNEDYRCNHIELEILSSYYELDNWRYTAKRLFKQAAILLKPFYAEIIPSDMSQICSWWWKGLPKTMGNTVIVGEPYSSLWTSVQKYELIVDDLFYIDNEDLSVDKKIETDSKLKARRKISAMFKKDKNCFAENYKYAKIFPFDNVNR